MAKVREWFSKIGITERRLFLAAVISKGFDGLLEFLAGVILLTLGVAYIKHIAWVWASHRMFEHPNSRVAPHIQNAANNLTTHEKTFAGVYLILHGSLKAGLAIGMIREIRWVYPVAAVTISAFIGYQISRLAEHFNWILLVLTCLDGLIVVMIVIDYLKLRRSPSGESKGMGHDAA